MRRQRRRPETRAIDNQDAQYQAAESLGTGSVGEREQAGRPDHLAGYRVLRKIGESARSEHYLGRFRDSDVVVLKTQSRDCSSADREVAVASAVGTGQYLVVALDIASWRSGTCVVLPWMSGGVLSQLFDRRQSLSPGEAVTLGISVCRGLAELHRAGFAHTRVDAHRVLLDSAGRPRLGGLGGCQPLSEFASETRSQAIQYDFDALRSLFSSLIGDPVTASLDRAFRGPWRAVDYEASWQHLEDELFVYAEPMPLEGLARGEDADALDGIPSPQAGLWGHDSSRLERLPSAPQHGRRAARPAVRSRPSWRSRVREGPAALHAALHTALRSRRKLVWFAGTAAGVLAAVGVTLLPPQQADARGDGPTPSHDTVVVETEQPGSAPSGKAASLSGNDPVAAARVLLTRREHCLSIRSLSCLEQVDQFQSPLLDADRSAVSAARSAGSDVESDDRISERLFASGQATLIDRTGGSALLALPPSENEPPVSLLMIKGEMGWRLREFFGG